MNQFVCLPAACVTQIEVGQNTALNFHKQTIEQKPTPTEHFAAPENFVHFALAESEPGTAPGQDN